MIPDEMRGFLVVKYCPRGREDCSSLSQMISTCGNSFICCGHNDGSTRVEPTDRFRVCFKNGTFEAKRGNMSEV